MPTPNERLAASLSALQRLQKSGQRVFRSGQLRRVHRERLLRNGFVQEVMKGWLVSSNPSAQQGDSTPWYASFWEFCARYCDARFGDEWLARCSWPLAVRLHTPLSRRQRTHGPIPDERHAGLGRLSVDGYPR